MIGNHISAHAYACVYRVNDTQFIPTKRVMHTMHVRTHMRMHHKAVSRIVMYPLPSQYDTHPYAHTYTTLFPRIPHHAQRMPSRSDLAWEGTRQVRRCAGYRYSKRSCRAGHMHARTKRMALLENPVLATNAEGTREDQCSIGVHWHVNGKVDAV